MLFTNLSKFGCMYESLLIYIRVGGKCTAELKIRLKQTRNKMM